MAVDIWTYRSDADLGVDLSRGVDLTGFAVEALDGGIGKIDEATYDTRSSYVVVDTGPWIFGKKVMLPAGVIDRIDLQDETVWVVRTKDEIGSAPEVRRGDPCRRVLPRQAIDPLRASEAVTTLVPAEAPATRRRLWVS